MVDVTIQGIGSEKTTPVSTDTLEIQETAGGASKYVTAANLTKALSVVTVSAQGVMSAADKSKLDAIEASANNYSHPNHTGDVTSSGDGAQTIANDAVTYAKMQNITATARLLGRKTAGAGDVEELSEADLKSTMNLEVGTDVQAYDAGLQSISGLTTGANKGIYTTALDTYATYDLTAFARSILDDADAATVRSTIGAAIGSDVQAYDATLASIAALGTAADKLAYTTGIDTWAEAAITAAGRAILDDADASAQRTTLGVAIGSDVQAYDSGLASIAGLSTGADKGIYTSGSDVYATYDLTSGARTFSGVSHNYAAIAAPTVNDDSTGGYGPGSQWFDTTNDKAYVCLDGTATAAVWTEITQAGGGSGDMLASTYDPAAISEQLVGLTAAQALTNKTLTQPTITIKQGTAPTAEGDLQWNATNNTLLVGDSVGTKVFSDDSTRNTQSATLTNKTIDGDNNTISNLDIGNEVDWAALGDVTDRTAFASGDKLLIFEAGVGLRKIDYDDLPSGGSSTLSGLSDTTISGAAADDFLVYNAGSWANRTAAQARTHLALEVTNAGDPTGVVTPGYAGQACRDTTNGIMYWAMGATSADWKAGGLDSETGTSGQIIVYDGSGVPTAVAMSGDATIVAGGAVSIGAGKVTLAMLDDTTLPGIQSIEGLGSAADKFLYTTAADTYAEGDITSGARGVLSVAHNLAATAAPTATDDTGSGYGPGSMWIDTTNDKAYVCLDGTSTAAVWTETTQSGGSPSLASLSDTTITAATSGDFLMHNGTAWVDQTTAEVKTTLALNNVENTALSTWAGSANITTLGTITTGTWTGTTIAVANGGTGSGTAAGARTNLGLVIGTDVQAYNSGLALFAGVTHNFSATAAPTVNDDVTGGYGPGSHWIDTTNDKAYICLDGTDTAAVWTETTQSGGSPSLASLSDTTITAAVANDFLMHNGSAWVDTSPANARTALGLVIGTNVQAQDAGLQSIAGLTTAANKGIYTTASDTYATFDLTASARTFTGLTHNFSATAAPATGTDDTTLGYGPGSLWVDTTNDKAYICLDGTDTAAVWTEITGAGGSGPSVTSGAGAPGSTPSAVGDIYVDTTNDIVYLAAGTASSADWKEGGVGSVLPTDYTDAAIVGADTMLFEDATDSTVKSRSMTNIISDLSIVTSPEFADNVFRINDNTDATKQLAFEVSGITTATTRTWTVPDTNVTVTSFAATFLDDANGAAVMSTLGFGNVENTAISTWAGSANVTTLGTVTTGTWNGTTIAVANGGTGSTTAAGAATNLGLGTGDSPQFTGIELGHATDTTLTRSAAGVVAVEGVDLATIDDVETTTVNAQTGTTYTLVIGDRGQTVTMDNAAANTLTIPTNASVAFAVGSVISVLQKGAGATTISGATGVTVNGVSAGSGAINTRYNGVSLTKIATDTWIASGDIATVA